MAMVVNMGTNDQYFVFRGSEAREFIAGLTFISRRQVRLVLANRRRIKSELLITAAKTLCLWMDCEDINDQFARLLFDITVERFAGEVVSRNGRH